MDQSKFVFESSEVEAMKNKLGLNSVLDLLPIIVRSSQKLARPPISNFSVSAAGLSTDGRIFIGVNIEFPGLPLHHSIHAEQFLITNVSFQLKPLLSHVVVSAYPCGHCRQFFQEIRGSSDIQIHVLSNEGTKSSRIDQYPDGENVCFKELSYFLPNRFGPEDLLDKYMPLLLEKQDNNLVIVPENNDKLVMAALEGANRSHAPYSKCPSGIALIDVDGYIYKGSYLESAAYNPSLGPAQAAIIAFVAGGGNGYEKIVRAVLVEMEGAIVRQEETVRLLLKAISPKCEFHVFNCQKISLDEAK